MKAIIWFGKKEDALIDYTKAIDIIPLYADTYNKRGSYWLHF